MKLPGKVAEAIDDVLHGEMADPTPLVRAVREALGSSVAVGELPSDYWQKDIEYPEPRWLTKLPYAPPGRRHLALLNLKPTELFQALAESGQHGLFRFIERDLADDEGMSKMHQMPSCRRCSRRW